MKHKLIIEFEDQADTMQAGLRQTWIDGKAGKGDQAETINLSCGAGLGSPWLIFSRTPANGNTVYLIADVRPLIGKLAAVAKKVAQPQPK